MGKSYRIILMLCLCLGLASPAVSSGTPAEAWDGLLEVTYKFSWYPRQDLQKLLDLKGAEYGQSLTEYRNLLLREITGRAAGSRLDPADFIAGLPWRKYYRLSLAEFCLFLSTDEPQHLQNAIAALSVLAKKTGQPEIEYYNYLYGAHQACLKGDRAAFIAETYRIWQNVILRFELETLLFPSEEAQTGFVRSLPFLYENVSYLVIRKAILEKEIPELYPLGTVILDIQPKLTIENGHKDMVAQLVERMHGVNSDNGNLNYAVALLEATATRYDFEDEKDETRLAAKYHLTRKYYHLAYTVADTGKGKAAVLTQQMGFMNYLIRRFSDRRDLLLAKAVFNNAPALANDSLEEAFNTFDRLAAPDIQAGGFRAAGFDDRESYLQSMHQLLDSSAKLAIVVSAFYRAEPETAPVDIFPAVRPLQQYTALFARHARLDSEVLPDNAYFLAAYAARELASLYREHTRFSTDDRASALSFAYQLQSSEIFPLDLPGILQLAFQSTLDGRVPDYFRYSSPLAARLRVSADASSWPARHGSESTPLLALLPTVVPEVIDNAFTFLRHFPEEPTSEEVVFGKAVLMAQTLASLRKAESPERIDEVLSGIGRGDQTAAPAGVPAGSDGAYQELKNRLYASPDNPTHRFLRTLFNEVPYENHPYVGLMRSLR